MTIFDYNDTDGGVFVKKIPSDLNKYIDPIRELYLKESDSNELNNTINHIWYTKSSNELKSLMQKFQNHPFFKNLCNKSNNCKIENVSEMDEIMYANFKKINNNNINYYGATGNFVQHHDCEPCSLVFKKTHLYRILIGLTNENEYIVTKFVNYDIGKNINKGDMLGFDFDKTLHQVINTNNKQETPRILMKLHFLVCEDCNISDEYFKKIKQFYINYDKLTRNYTKIGTDPEYFHEFAIGLTAHYMYYSNIRKILLIYFIISLILIQYINKYKINLKNSITMVLQSLKYLFIIYLLITIFYWLRYVLFNIK